MMSKATGSPLFNTYDNFCVKKIQYIIYNVQDYSVLYNNGVRPTVRVGILLTCGVDTCMPASFHYLIVPHQTRNVTSYVVWLFLRLFYCMLALCGIFFLSFYYIFLSFILLYLSFCHSIIFFFLSFYYIIMFRLSGLSPLLR